MRCGKCEKELHACICAWVKTWGGDEWCSLAGTTREWGEGMVEKLVAVTKDEFAAIICHESIKDMVELKRAWAWLDEEDIKEIERWVEFKEAGSIEPISLGKLVVYISDQLRKKNNG